MDKTKPSTFEGKIRIDLKGLKKVILVIFFFLFFVSMFFIYHTVKFEKKVEIFNSKISIGMKESEVIKLLGKPTCSQFGISDERILNITGKKEIEIYELIYSEPFALGDDISLYFDWITKTLIFKERSGRHIVCKSNILRTIDFTMFISKDLGSNEIAMEFFRLLKDLPQDLVPKRVEPFKHKFNKLSSEDFCKFWFYKSNNYSGILVSRRKPFQGMKLDWSRDPKREFNHFYYYIEEEYFEHTENAEKLLNVYKKLYSLFKADYGYVCHSDDFDLKNIKYTNYLLLKKEEKYNRDQISIEISEQTEKELQKGLTEHLPGIYWANFFGPIYVEFFGREKLLSAPAYKVEELPEGGILLLTSASPLDWDNPETKEIERAVVEHLGKEAFFDRNDPQRKHRAPIFNHSNVINDRGKR